MPPDLQVLQAYCETLLTLHPEHSWAQPRARRLIRLAQRIADGMDYDRAVLLCAAYLHDLSGFAAYGGAAGGSRPAVEADWLARLRENVPLSAEQAQNLLECVALADPRDPRPAASVEALLLREANALDRLGAVGLARAYLAGPNDLEKVTARIQTQMRDLSAVFLLPASQRLAAQRIAEMEAFLAALEDELRA